MNMADGALVPSMSQCKQNRPFSQQSERLTKKYLFLCLAIRVILSINTYYLNMIQRFPFPSSISFSRVCNLRLQLHRRANSIVQSIHLVESGNNAFEGIGYGVL